jgi:UDP-GlcNAc3NAcA epimerase
MLVVSIVGTRPQFIKVAIVDRAIRIRHRHQIIHTGQHSDPGMSGDFFRELHIPDPDVRLPIGSRGNAGQVGEMIPQLTEQLMLRRPEVVLVYGDTNSTLAGALAAVYTRSFVAHVESGVRSFERDLIEESNRVVTDHISDLLFATDDRAMQHLRQEGLGARAVLTGDVMHDLVVDTIDRATPPAVPGLDRDFILLTIHRAGTVDDPDTLAGVLTAVASAHLPVIFAVHPRTRRTLETHDIAVSEGVTMIPPVSYLEMLWLEHHASIVVTDSGGVQREASWLGRPCVILRETTEWLDLVDNRHCLLAGTDPARIAAALGSVDTRPRDVSFVRQGVADRIVHELEERLRD